MGAHDHEPCAAVSVAEQGRSGDLVDDCLSYVGIPPGAVHLSAEIVDHYAGSARGQQLRVRPANAPTGAGNERHTSFEPQVARMASGVARAR